jgi:hypothetical protein
VNVDALIRLIESEQHKFAIAAVTRPTGQSSFDYGRAVGMYAGLEHIRACIIDLVTEKERKDRDL